MARRYQVVKIYRVKWIEFPGEIVVVSFSRRVIYAKHVRYPQNGHFPTAFFHECSSGRHTTDSLSQSRQINFVVKSFEKGSELLVNLCLR